MVVDDEADIREILTFNLQNEGYRVVAAQSAEEALDLIEQQTPQLILLDVMMSGMSGFNMADLLRRQNSKIPIIFLTAKNTENDMLTGFSIGADDYIRKPFSIREVIARVKSVLRRTNEDKLDNSELISYPPLLIDTDAKLVMLNDKRIDVTKTEYDILLLLVSNKGRTFSRAEILDVVWANEVVLERTVDVHIARLRKKLGEVGDSIINRVGFGYSFM